MEEHANTFSSDRAFENAFLVYIQGIEVPVLSASVRYEVGSLPQAVLQMAPDPELARLGMEDRIEVQIFYKDNYFSTVMGLQPQFRLLFDGTIEGWSYSHSALGRSISFQVSHSSKLLLDTQVFFLTGFDSAAKAAGSQETQTGANTAISPLVYPWSMLFNGIASDGKESMKRPYDLIRNFFKMSVDQSSVKENQSLINCAFLMRSIHRRGLLYQFIPSPILEFEEVRNNQYHVFPLLGDAQSQTIINAIGSKVQQLGMQVNLWDIFNYVYSQMYYEIGTILAPPIAQVDFNPTSANLGIVLGPPHWSNFSITGSKPKSQDFSQWDKQTKPNFLIHHVTKPQWLFGIAPACNVIFPSMIEELDFSESYSAQPTRCYVDSKELFDNYGANGNPVFEELAKLRGAYPPMADQMMQSKTRDRSIADKNLLVWPAEYFRGPQVQTLVSPPILLRLKEEALNSFTPDQIAAQAALDYINLRVESLSKLALDKARKDADAKAAAQHMTPSDETRSKTITDNLSQSLLDQENLLIDELKTRKILTEPVKTIDDLRRQLSQKMSADAQLCFTLLRRFAQMEYFRQGAAARSGSVTMPFNPYIVAGFPVVIFNSEEDGNHFVGHVVAIEHQLSATSMRTVVSFAMGQTLDEYLQNIYDANIGNNQDNLVDSVAAAPANPIPVIRRTTQYQDKAEAYFSRVLHQSQIYGATTEGPSQVKAAAFNVVDAVRFQIPGDEKLHSLTDALADADAVKFKQKFENVQSSLQTEFDKDFALAQENIKKRLQANKITGPAYDTALAQETDAARVNLEQVYRSKAIARFLELPRKNPKNEILDRYTALVPSTEFAPMFAKFESAMYYVSRPVCTLEEYVRFRGPWGWAQNKVPADDPRQGKGADYYARILTFKEGPGDPPKIDANTNIPMDPLPKDLPETRMAWSARLENYRKRFLYGK